MGDGLSEGRRRPSSSSFNQNSQADGLIDAPKEGLERQKGLAWPWKEAAWGHGGSSAAARWAAHGLRHTGSAFARLLSFGEVQSLCNLNAERALARHTAKETSRSSR